MKDSFLDSKITKANFNTDPEHTLKPDQYERVARFLRWHNPPLSTDIVNAIIVPTTSPNFDRESFDRRIAAAITYSKLFPFASVVFAGKRPDLSRATLEEREAQYSEAGVMSQKAIDQGLDGGRVVLEELSLHAGENVKNSLELLMNDELRGILVVCSSYMARRMNYYLRQELGERKLLESVRTFIFDSDVAEDLEGGIISPKSDERKLRSILYEAKRLSRYRRKGDL